MENNNIENQQMVNRSGKVWAGLFIIGVGSLLLLKNFGLDFPDWLFRWHTILIVIGLFVGIKHRFQHSGWIIMVLIGSYFMLEDALNLDFNFTQVTLPIILISLGLLFIFKPKGNFNRRHERWKRKQDKWNRKYGVGEADSSNYEYPEPESKDNRTANGNDYLESVNVFGGSHQSIYSKNFKGGEIVAVFGGCDLNLTQSDFDGTIEIDITAVFGGCKIIVPSGWQVKSEVTAIFGGLDDKRSVQPIGDGPQKILILRGIAMFGGIDIRNF
jgi:predicted membrane protein